MDVTDLNRASLVLKSILQLIILVGLLVSIYERNWLNAIVVTGIIALTMAPAVFASRFSIPMPPIFEFATIGFLFASASGTSWASCGLSRFPKQAMPAG